MPTSSRRRRPGPLAMPLAAALAALVTVATSAAPARATERCVAGMFNSVCVNVTGGEVWGEIVGPYSDLTQVVRQCDGLGRNCVVITASHGNPTSRKPVAAGHVYKNCATWTDPVGVRWVNVCSPFIAVPT